MRSLRHHSFLRTNQFDVEDQLKGFEERFRVIGREGLANALNARLEALNAHQTKWTPDILRFLLELSDQPAHKSKLSDLDLLYESETEYAPKLTWEEIAQEDGWLQDRATWRNIDYSPSSDDEAGDHDLPLVESDAESLGTASLVAGSCLLTAQGLVSGVVDGHLMLCRVEESQSWRSAPPVRDGEGRAKKTPVSSLQVLRDVLFMLGGLETTLFDSECRPSLNYQLVGVSWETYRSLATSFSECGRKLAPIRAFVGTKQKMPLLQVFEDSLRKVLHAFDQTLASIHGRFVSIEKDTILSLMSVLDEIKLALAPLNSLSSIVEQLQVERNPHAFRYLELLFDAVGIAQLDGSLSTYELLGTIFFDCFQVYLKPIRLWMEEGRLLEADRTFFVSESAMKRPLAEVWKSQFNLLKTPEGTLHAPRFLRPSIDRIFTTGKSIVVLKHLKHHHLAKNRRDQDEPRMDFETVCPEHLDFAPFSELFGSAFQGWIQSKHHTASATLRELLFNAYGLSEGLDALQRIYLMSDGARSDMFASSVFRHLDNLSASWKDRFTLQEIAQEAFSVCVDGFRLSADIDTRRTAHSGAASRSSVRLSLPAVRLTYQLNWPVQMIVPAEAVQGYQTMFTFLLQVRRAISMLTHPILGFSAGSDTAVDRPAAYHLLRTKLLWFCNIIMSYVTTLVLAPNIARLREELRKAPDVDDMISAHSSFIKRIISESCHGPKLQPIQECMLDVFDLAIQVEDVQNTEMTRLAEEEEEVSRLSVISSPYKMTPKGKGRRSLLVTPRKGSRHENDDDDGDDDDDDDDDDMDWRPAHAARKAGKSVARKKPHREMLRDMHAEFDRHLRFVAGGLRGVARASRDEAAPKWDLLAEMLEVGIQE